MADNSPRLSRFVAFQYRDFRLQWIGQGLSLIGTNMQQRTVEWHVYALLRNQVATLNILGHPLVVGVDVAALGGLGLMRVIPVILFGMYGGMIADAANRRTVLIWTQVIAAVFAGALAIITLTGHDSVWIVYLVSALMSAVTAFANPARQAMVPNIVAREHLTNAATLNNVMWQLSTIFGPAAAGLLIARFNRFDVIYGINAVSFLFMLAALLLMTYRGQAQSERVGVSMNSMIEGIRFTRDSSLIWSTMILDFLATFFASASTMLPKIADSVLHVGPGGFGLLASAEAVGAVVTGLFLLWRKNIRRQGMVMIVSVMVYGLATLLFGMAISFALAFLMLAIVGAADTISTIIRSTLRQLITPDHLRGRMMGVNMIFFQGGPQLGEVEAGLVAAFAGAPLAIVSGGVLTVLITLLVAWKYPSLRAYVSEDVPANASA